MLSEGLPFSSVLSSVRFRNLFLNLKSIELKGIFYGFCLFVAVSSYPCIQEISDALELQKKYADKPIVFLSVALEYDEENIAEWKNFIAGKNERFPGIHVVAEKQSLNFRGRSVQ